MREAETEDGTSDNVDLWMFSSMPQGGSVLPQEVPDIVSMQGGLRRSPEEIRLEFRDLKFRLALRSDEVTLPSSGFPTKVS